MKLQVLQENLAKGVAIASRFASSKAQLPILGNILLSAKKSKIFIASTNLEISASIQVGAKIEEDGEISVPSKVFSELLANLPKDTITLESEKEQLKIITPGFSSKVLGMNSSDFPKIPVLIGEKDVLPLAQEELSSALSRVLFSTSTDETRPVLTGVLFILSKGNLSLVSTDGFRLSRKELKIDQKQIENKKVVVPKGVLGEIQRLEEGGGTVGFCLKEEEKQVLFGVDNIVLTSRLIEGEYPDFEKIIPKSSNITILVDKEELLRSVKLASIFAREAANIVRLKILSDSLKVTAESGSSGNQETKVDAKVTSTEKDFEISFNYRFLEDFLHSVSGEEVKIDFSGVSAPGVFTDPSDPTYLHLIMPVKVQG